MSNNYENRREIEFLISRENILNANRPVHRFIKSKTARFLRELSFNEGEKIKLEDKDFAPFSHFKITAFISPPTRVRIDPPNVYPTIKPLIDGLTDAGFWEDDNFRHLLDTSFRYGGLSGEKGFYKVNLIIEEIEDISNFITDV